MHNDPMIIFTVGLILGAFAGCLVALVISHFIHQAQLDRVQQEAKSEARNRLWSEALNHLQGGHHG
jgi:hypothetical protein